MVLLRKYLLVSPVYLGFRWLLLSNEGCKFSKGTCPTLLNIPQRKLQEEELGRKYLVYLCYVQNKAEAHYFLCAYWHSF